MKLSGAGKGKYLVISIDSSSGLKEKLLRQGIIPGKEILVVEVRKKGPCVVQVDDTRMIIGAGMTEKIEVKKHS